MQYVRLGSAGLKVSRLCLGAMSYGSKTWREWVLEEEEGRPYIRRALELGINFFDTADMYSLGRSEEILGRALRDFGGGRDRVVIATKVFNPMNDDPNGRGLSRKHIRHSIDDSLRRLGTDYVDLYQIHRLDRETPMEEIIAGLDDVVRAGKVLYVGASSMFAWQFAKMLYLADQLGRAPFVSMQNHYNVVYREEEREMLPLCRAEGIAVLPWSPLARGFVTRSGNTVRSETDDYGKTLYGSPADQRVAARVSEVAGRRGVPNAQVALAWVLSRPGVTAPIVGATKMHHLEDAVAALDLQLDSGETAALDELYEPHRVLGHS
jgi:1-deoxyxylulose-5-phosphate synthase